MTPRRMRAAEAEAVLALLRAAFAGMEGRIDPPSSLHRLTVEAIRAQNRQGEVWVIAAPGPGGAGPSGSSAARPADSRRATPGTGSPADAEGAWGAAAGGPAGSKRDTGGAGSTDEAGQAGAIGGDRGAGDAGILRNAGDAVGCAGDAWEAGDARNGDANADEAGDTAGAGDGESPDGPLCACVFLTPRPAGPEGRPGRLYIGKLAVAEAARGQGLARRLIDLAAARAMALGLPLLELQTRVELTENHATFRRLGFTQTGATAHAGHDRPTSLTFARPVVR